MAKIKFGMLMTDARGKLGGQVFSKNRAGAYIRTKVTPLNPQTISQSVVRSNLGTLSSSWSSLTASQIAQWNKSVEDWQSTDIFGDIKKPTGKNLYVKLNLNLLSTKQTKIVEPPQKMELPEITPFSVEIDTTTSAIEINGLPTFTAGRFMLEACPPVSRGVNFVKNKFRFITEINHPSASTVDVSDAYISRFGSVSGAENIFFRVRAIGANGQAGVPFVVKANIA